MQSDDDPPAINRCQRVTPIIARLRRRTPHRAFAAF
jgi:hypothetical protein